VSAIDIEFFGTRLGSSIMFATLFTTAMNITERKKLSPEQKSGLGLLRINLYWFSMSFFLWYFVKHGLLK